MRGHAQLKLKQPKFFLLFELLGGGVFCCCLNRLGLIGAGAGIHIARFGEDVSFLTQFLQVGAQGGLKLLHINRVLDTAFDFAQGRDAGVVVLCDFQDDEALPGADNVRDFARLHGKSFVFKFLSQGASLESPQVAALGGSRTIGILFGDVLKTASLTDLCEQVLRFSFCCGQALRIIGGI